MAEVNTPAHNDLAGRVASTAPADAVALMPPRRSGVSGVRILNAGEAITLAVLTRTGLS